MDDNPLVDIASGRMLSNGNFHPMVLALALDALRPAAAHVGQLSDRRMNHLWASVADVFSDEGVMERLVDEGGGLSRYAAAALASELRHAANPGDARHRASSTSAWRTTRRTPRSPRRSPSAPSTCWRGSSRSSSTWRRIAHDAPARGRRPAPAVAAAFASLGEARASAGPRPSSGRGPRGRVQAPCATRCSTPRGRRSRPADRRRLLPSAGHVRPPALLPDDRDRVREQRPRASTRCTR